MTAAVLLGRGRGHEQQEGEEVCCRSSKIGDEDTSVAGG